MCTLRWHRRAAVKLLGWVFLLVGALALASVVWAQGPDEVSGGLACAPDEYEPDDAPAQATWVIPNNAPTSHTFNPAGDRDYVRFQAVAGMTYILSTDDLTAGADTVLTLWDQDGTTRLAYNDDDPAPDRGLASRVEWVAPASGVYFASVHEFANKDCRGYRLSLRMVRAEGTYVPDVLKAFPQPTPTPTTACAPFRLARVLVGAHPKSVAVGPGRAYVGLYDSASLAVVDTASLTLLRTVQGAGRGANGVALSGSYVYLAHRDSASVSVFHAADPNAFQQTLAVGLLPFGVAALADRVFVANFGSDSVTVIDSAANSVLRTEPIGAHPALAAAGGARGWVTTLGSAGGARVLDRDGKLVRTIATGAEPFGIAYNPLLGRLYVGHWADDSLWAIDAATGARLQRAVLPDRPFAVAVNPTTGHVFVILARQDRLLALREDTLAQVADLPLEDQGGDDGGQGLAVYEDRVYVADYGAGSLTVFQDAACRP